MHFSAIFDGPSICQGAAISAHNCNVALSGSLIVPPLKIEPGKQQIKAVCFECCDIFHGSKMKIDTMGRTLNGCHHCNGRISAIQEGKMFPLTRILKHLLVSCGGCHLIPEHKNTMTQ